MMAYSEVIHLPDARVTGLVWLGDCQELAAWPHNKFRVADHPGAMRVRANRNAAGYQASTHSDYSSLSTAFRNALTDVLAAWAAAGS